MVLEDSNYDIIIVGAGTAGCVLANRLSEDDTLQILLLEAGSNRNDDPRVKIPGKSRTLADDPDYDWQFASEPQAALNGRVVKHPRGKIVGGSSAINSHALVYPSKACLDAWADLGNEGWDWEHMLPYYYSSQTTHHPSEVARERLQVDYVDQIQGPRLSGPIDASFPLSSEPLQEAWIETFRSQGCAVSGDQLSEKSIGGVIAACAITPGLQERSHAGNAYFASAAKRQNLRLITEALVYRVLLDKSRKGDLVATGVEYSCHGQRSTASARREVIVCAGAFQSPQLLELSGIGSASLLSSYAIEVMYNSPHVGENLQDHLCCGPSVEVADTITTADVGRDPANAQKAVEAYARDRTGPLAEGGTYSFAYHSLQMLNSDEENAQVEALLENHLEPETMNNCGFPSQKMQYDFISRAITDPSEATATIYMTRKQRHMDKATQAEVNAFSSSENYISIIAMLAHPFSRGSVHIRSSDPAEKPTVDFKYLTHPLDAEILARHVCSFKKLIACEPLASCIKPGGKRLPASFPNAMDSIEQAKEMLRACAATNYHPAGTCAMIAEELGGVVNDRLVVYGTTNLRVCDASVMPIIPRGNILTTVYAAAEKGADIIKEDLRTRGAAEVEQTQVQSAPRS